jgi:hypothetical protein
MQFTVRGEPRFEFRLTREQVDVLVKMSFRHYDSTCRAASANAHPQIGVIGRWANQLEYEKDWPVDVPLTPMEASWRELDLCLKVLEYTVVCFPAEVKVASALTLAFIRALRETRVAREGWTLSLDTAVSAAQLDD